MTWEQDQFPVLLCYSSKNEGVEIQSHKNRSAANTALANVTSVVQ